MVRQLIPSNVDPAGWGSVPTIGGNVTTAVPDPITGVSAVSTQQSDTATIQALSQKIVLPPPPGVVMNTLDPSGSLLMWAQNLIRKLGGYSATPAEDALVAEDSASGVDLFSRAALMDLQVSPENLQTQVALLSQRLDDLTILVLEQTNGWNRQPAQTAATTAAPAGGTGTAAGAWDTAGNRDTAITYLNNVGSRLAALETKLKTIGVLS